MSHAVPKGFNAEEASNFEDVGATPPSAVPLGVSQI